MLFYSPDRWHRFHIIRLGFQSNPQKLPISWWDRIFRLRSRVVYPILLSCYLGISILSQITRVMVWQTDGQTDGQTEFSSLDRVYIPCSAVTKVGPWYRPNYSALPLTLRLKSIRKVALLANIRYDYFWALVRVDIILHRPSPNSYNKLTK